MARYAGFVGPSYTSQSRIAADDRTVNLYPERIEGGTGEAEYALYPAPGFSTYCTLSDTPVRGLYTLNGRSFAVGGTTLYELPTSSGGSPVSRASGLSNPDNSRAQMAGNGDAGNQLLITSGARKYSLDLTTYTLTVQAAPATQCGFMDGYGLALDTSRSELSISALEDFSTWDPLDIAQRSDTADKWQAMLVRQKDLWLFGSQTSSVWYNNGDAAFPFAPNPSVFTSQGILAPQSAALLNGVPYWLGQGVTGGGIVYRADGYTPVRVSNHAVEYWLSTYGTLTDGRAFTYQDQGHDFYVLTFPTAQATWVYDATEGLWHERGDWNGYIFTGLSVDNHTYANGVHLVGSTTTGVVYQMATTVATGIDGNGLRRIRRAPHLQSERKRIAYDRFQLDLEVGLGLTSGQGSDPKIALRWSNDGGQTWGAERSVSAGPTGAYLTRAIWRQLGMARDRVFEVIVSDPIPWRFVDAFLDVRTGT